MELNQQQQQTVSQINGASLIISGAGTGKSTVLAAKIAAIQAHYGDEVPGLCGCHQGKGEPLYQLSAPQQQMQGRNRTITVLRLILP